MRYADAPDTLEGIEAIPGEILVCADISKVLKAQPGDLHAQAMYDPKRLGFPVIVCGTRVKIPKRPFVKFMREGLTDGANS